MFGIIAKKKKKVDGGQGDAVVVLVDGDHLVFGIIAKIGKRLPGPLSKSSIQFLFSSGREVRDKVQGKESLSLELPVDMELVVAGGGVQQTGADQMGVLGVGVEVEVEHRS